MSEIVLYHGTPDREIFPTYGRGELWNYFTGTENYQLKDGSAIQGFIPDWMGEFYAYYQWYFDVPSAVIIQKIPVDFLVRAYPGLHDLDLELAVKR